MLQPGTQIGRYEIQRKLARGGMGTVYVAHDPVLGRMVAIKVFVGDLDVPDAAERFGREARAAASLNHTNIVTIYDFGEVASQPYIVMEYIQGETITELIRRRTAVPVAQKLQWLEELCAGACSAHKMDVVHRDIKPSNLMIDRGGRLKILDFGIAKIVNSLGSSMTAVIGTPGYMAPEQLLGQPVDARTDIFAIGVVSFELLTYEEAFQGESFTAVTHRIINEDVRNVSDLVPDAPPDLCAIVAKSLQKNPADRYQDAESLRIAISRVRRRIEQTADFDPSSAPTIVSPMALPVRKIGTGTAGKSASVGPRTAELTPPPDPSTEREALARAQQAKMQGALQRGEACLQNEEFERALAASNEVLEIEPAHAGARALQLKIKTAMAKQRASALLADARVELQRGALTRCKMLLEEARNVDPATHDAALERELRLARVEEERKRHRTETATRTIAVARAALERQDVEAALALAREALSLDPNSSEARDIEITALRALEAGDDDSRPTIMAPVEEATDDETTIIALPHHTPPPGTLAGRATSEAVPIMPPVPPAPAPAPAPETPSAASAPVPLPLPVRLPVNAAPPPVTPAPVQGKAAPAGAPSQPAVAHAPAPVAPPAGAGTATKPAAPSATSAPVAKAPAVPVPPGGRVPGPTATQTQTVARTHGLPLAAVLALAGLIVLVLLVVAFFALRGRGPTTPVAPATGLVVIEAVPWANVTSIKGADGANRLSTAAVTPLTMTLPAGKYTVELANPASPTDTKTITLDVTAGGQTVAPASRFVSPSSDEYFNQYFGGSTPAASSPDAGAATTPEGTAPATNPPPPGATP